MTKKEVMEELREDAAKIEYYGVLSIGGINLSKFTKKELIEIATFLGNQVMSRDGEIENESI